MHEGFEKILDEFGPSVYRMAMARTGDPEKSADIYQDTFLLLLEKQPSFRHKNQLRVWLMRTAHYFILKEYCKPENTHTQPLDGITVVHTDELAFELYDLLSTLPESLRDAAVLFYIEDMSIKDISKILGLSVSAVKSRLMRARGALKTVLKEEEQ